ncbi:MAG: TonB-dependent receptor [Pseudomonadota bacterium]
MRLSERLIWVCSITGALIAFACSNVFAQSAESPLDVIVVTGTKLGLSQQDTASSVTIVDADRIDKDYILNIEDVFDRTANAFTGTTGFGAYSIRGVKNTNVIDGFNRTNALSTVVINGTALGLSAADYLKPSLFDAEVVEVLRGPQSIAQGPNTLIGSIVVNYNSPTFDGYEGRVLAEAGTLGTYRVATVQNVELVDDNLAARVALETRQADGDVSNPTTGQDDVQRTDEETLRLQLLWQPDAIEGFSGELTYLRNRSDSNPFANVPSDPDLDFSVFDRIQLSDQPEDYPSDYEFSGLAVDWQFTEAWSLSAVLGYGAFSSDQALDGDLTPFPLLTLGTAIEEDILSQEIRLNYVSDQLNLIVGVFHSDGEFTNGFDLQGVFPDGMGGFIPFNQSQRNQQNIEQTAVFAQADIRLSERWATTLGMRINQEDRDFSSTTDQPGVPVSFVGNEDFDQFLPSISVRFMANEANTLGALYNRGYQGGGFSAALVLGEVRPYEEEFIDNYELFWRYQAADGDWQANLNIFYFDWQDQQVPFTPTGGIPGFDEFIGNAGASTVYGFELEVSARLSMAFDVFGAVGLSETEFDEFTIDNINLAGSSFPGSPAWNASAGLIYQNSHGWFGSGTITYVDDTYTELGSQDFTAISERRLLAAKLGYRGKRWSVYAFGENLLDEDYELGLFDRRQLGVNGSLGTVANPRTIGVGFDWSWE